eukprot:2191192-Rhodomonas_salina.3
MARSERRLAGGQDVRERGVWRWQLLRYGAWEQQKVPGDEHVKPQAGADTNGALQHTAPCAPELTALLNRSTDLGDGGRDPGGLRLRGQAGPRPLAALDLVERGEEEDVVLLERVGEAVERRATLGRRVEVRQGLELREVGAEQLFRRLGAHHRDHVALAGVGVDGAHGLVLGRRDLHESLLAVHPAGVGGVERSVEAHPHQHTGAVVGARPVARHAVVAGLRAPARRLRHVAAHVLGLEVGPEPAPARVEHLAQLPQL